MEVAVRKRAARGVSLDQARVAAESTATELPSPSPAQDAASGRERAAAEVESGPASASSFRKRQKPQVHLPRTTCSSGQGRHVNQQPVKRKFAHPVCPSPTTHKRALPAHLTAVNACLC